MNFHIFTFIDLKYVGCRSVKTIGVLGDPYIGMSSNYNGPLLPRYHADWLIGSIVKPRTPKGRYHARIISVIRTILICCIVYCNHLLMSVLWSMFCTKAIISAVILRASKTKFQCNCERVEMGP